MNQDSALQDLCTNFLILFFKSKNSFYLKGQNKSKSVQNFLSRYIRKVIKVYFKKKVQTLLTMVQIIIQLSLVYSIFILQIGKYSHSPNSLSKKII